MNKQAKLAQLGKKLDKLGKYIEVELKNLYADKIKNKFLKTKKEELNKYKQLLNISRNESTPIFFREELEKIVNIKQMEEEYEKIKNKIEKDIIISLNNYDDWNKKLTISLGDKSTRWSPSFLTLVYDNKTKKMFGDTPSGGWNEEVTFEEQLPGMELQLEIGKFLQNNYEILEEYIERYIKADENYKKTFSEYEEIKREIKKEEALESNIKLKEEEIDKLLNYITENNKTIYIHPKYREYNNGAIAEINEGTELYILPIFSSNKRHLGWQLGEIRYKRKNKEYLINELKQLYIPKEEYKKLIEEINQENITTKINKNIKLKSY